MKYYIAYGSNLYARQMKLRCPTATIAGLTKIRDYELLYKGSKTGAYLTIEPKAGGIVPAVVWNVEEEDENSLDRYEGFPVFYYKKQMEVQVKLLRNGRTVTVPAFVYIMHEERKLGIPSQTYVNCCKYGYRTFHFDVKYLDEAYERSLKGVISDEA